MPIEEVEQEEGNVNSKQMKDILDYFEKTEDAIFFGKKDKVQEELEVLYHEILTSNLPHDSNYYYVLGYIRYNKGDSFENVEFLYRKSLELDNQNEFCKYYYGFLLYDHKSYQKSISIFESIDFNFFTSIDQEWRKLKIEELIICSILYLYKQDIYMNIDNKFIEWLIDFKKLVKKGGEYFNFPTDLIKALNDFLENKKDIISPNFNYFLGEFSKLMRDLNLTSKYEKEYMRIIDSLNKNFNSK